MLEWALQAARALGNRAAEAWALHQLGTRALCLLDTATARAALTEALRLREALGDEIGAAVSRHNLQILLGPPPPPRSEGPDSPPSGGAGRLRLLLIGAVATITALLIAVPLARAVPWPSGSQPPTVTATATTGPAASANPGLTVPQGVRREATGPRGAPVEYSVSAAGASTPTCTPPSGATFPLGETIVRCSAGNSAGQTAEASFAVTVQDTTPPLLSVPSALAVPGATGATVTYPVSATDLVDGDVPVDCDRRSGSTFPAGDTAVSCVASDRQGNRVERSFTVSVTREPKPANMPPKLVLPEDRTIEGNIKGGATVTFAVSATDVGDNPPPRPSCDRQSGALFAVGPTRVTCSVQDSGGLRAEGSFTITVRDTEKPVLSLPQDPQTAEATSGESATVPYQTSATDIVDGVVDADCRPKSGEIFKVGETRVSCSAKDKAGNEAQGTFRVVVSAPMPDLVVRSIDRASVEGGESCVVRYTIENRGKGTARESVASIVIASRQVREVPPTQPLVPGESRQDQVSVPLGPCESPVAITVTVNANPDQGKRIEESDESNNARSDVLRPDLTVESVKLVPSRQSAALNNCTIEIEYTLRNVGKADARASTTRITTSPGSSREVPAERLGANQSLGYTATVPVACPRPAASTPSTAPTASTAVTVTVVVNADGEVDESNRNNNTASFP